MELRLRSSPDDIISQPWSKLCPCLEFVWASLGTLLGAQACFPDKLVTAAH